MSTIWLAKFGNYDLTDIEHDATFSTATTASDLIALQHTDGSINSKGSANAEKPAAIIPATFVIREITKSAFQANVDAFVLAMKKGRQKLYTMPAANPDPTTWRWTWAKVTGMSDPRSAEAGRWNTSIQVQFELPYPFWFNNPNAWYFDSGETFNSGLNFDTGVTTHSVTNGTTIDLTNNGNAESVYLQFTLRPDGGTVQNFQIDRVDPTIPTRIFETLKWENTLPDATHLHINCFKRRIWCSDSAYNPARDYLVRRKPQTHWMSLAPGANKLVISGTFGADADLDVYHENCYHNP